MQTTRTAPQRATDVITREKLGSDPNSSNWGLTPIFRVYAAADAIGATGALSDSGAAAASVSAVTARPTWIADNDTLDRAALRASALAATTRSWILACCAPETFARWTALAKPEGRLDAAKPEHWNALRFLLLCVGG